MLPSAMSPWAVPAAVLAAYLLGSLSPGWVLARTQGIDLRTAGSGATGATNAARVLGKSAYGWVLLLDALKAFVAVYGTFRLMPDQPWGALACPAAIAGHIWPIFLRFKGGRGAGPLMGGFIGLDWRIVGLAWIPGLIVGIWFRKGFAARAAAYASSLGFGLWILRRPGWHQGYTGVPAQIGLVLSWLLVLLAHREHFAKQVPG
jgi:glycerol-3-phosphate acyltransferase PlsY